MPGLVRTIGALSSVDAVARRVQSGLVEAFNSNSVDRLNSRIWQMARRALGSIGAAPSTRPPRFKSRSESVSAGTHANAKPGEAGKPGRVQRSPLTKGAFGNATNRGRLFSAQPLLK